MAVPGPSHMHGAAATQAGASLPGQARVAIAMMAVVSPNLNLPTWVGWVVGGGYNCSGGKHPRFIFSCPPLLRCVSYVATPPSWSACEMAHGANSFDLLRQSPCMRDLGVPLMQREETPLVVKELEDKDRRRRCRHTMIGSRPVRRDTH